MQQRIDQCVLAVTGAGMNDQPSRLVDHDQIFVFVKNLEGDRFRSIVDLVRWRLVYFNAIAGANDGRQTSRDAGGRSEG